MGKPEEGQVIRKPILIQLCRQLEQDFSVKNSRAIAMFFSVEWSSLTHFVDTVNNNSL